MNPSPRKSHFKPGDVFLAVVVLVAISLVARWVGGKFSFQQA